MPLSENSQLLVSALEATPLLADRFESIKFVNYDSHNDEKRGCFSLVFKAHDRIENAPVALKFYDIAPQWMNDTYRRSAFHREHEILQVLLTKERCLQLASALSRFDLDVPYGDGRTAVLPCEYFAVEWLDGELDAYFLRQEEFTAVDKLHLFNEITLAVEAIHRLEIFHRDLKPDNLRAYQENIKRVVVAIDLGTAARISSGYIQNTYHHQVGALAYAAPEAICGLAAHRKLAPYTDVYALGCLLFELFNRDIFFRALRATNPHCEAIKAVMAAHIRGIDGERRQLEAWDRTVGKFAGGVEAVDVRGAGSSVPPGIAPQLNDVVRGLTHIDYRNRRIDLEWVRRRIWAAIRVLENERMYQRRIAIAKERRRRRIEKRLKQAAKLRKLLGQG